MIKKQLVSLISAYLNKKELPQITDWENLFVFAKHHSLGNLFYFIIKDQEKVPNQIKEKAKQHFSAQTAQQMAQEYYADEIFKALKEKNIKFMPLKGYYLRKLYPIQEMRTSCDVDIFYDDMRGGEVDEILSGFGFESHSESVNHTEWSQGTITIEMHHALADNNDKYQEYYSQVWDRLICVDKSQYKFSAEDFYIYFLVHSVKHFTGGGFGIRTVLDVFIYNREVELNQEYLNAELEKLGLKKFNDCIKDLSMVWFGEKEKNDDTDIIAEYIFSSGTYGVSTNAAVIKGSGKESSVKKTKIKYFFKTLFPSYKSMKFLYPILKPLPILLPFMWVYRYFEVLFKRRSKFKATINNMKSIDKESIDKISKIIKITGIEN